MTDQEEKRLIAELRALPDYRGWTFVYVYPEYFSYSRGPYSVFFTPDWDGDAILPIQVQDDEGHVYEQHSKTLPLPHAGRTGKKLFDLVRPTLDAMTRTSHARKKSKSPAQLDREIAEVVGARPINKRKRVRHFSEWKDKTGRTHYAVTYEDRSGHTITSDELARYRQRETSGH